MVPRNAPPTAKKFAEKPPAVETRPFVPPSTAPRVRTIDRDLYLAEARDDPFDGLDEDAPTSLPPKRKQRAPCVEPGISRLEAERMMAVSKAEPVYIAEGKRKPARRQSKRTINPSKALNEVDQAPQRHDVLVDDEDCTRLVARILLDRS